MKKKILLLATCFSLLFSGTSFADDSLMESMKELESRILSVQEEIKEASRRLDEEQGRIEEIRMLAQLIEAEAGNQDLKGRILVGNVVLNRVRHPAWPNSVYDVIHQKGQFEVMRNGAFNRAGNHISETSMEAARRAYVETLDSGILYFATFKANGKGHWKHGGHWFSY